MPSSSLVAAVAVSVPSQQAQRIVEQSEIVRRAALLVAYADVV